MAVYYYMAAAGADEAAAAALTRYFAGLVLTLADGLTITCGARTIQDWERAWWAEVRPYGSSLNAVGHDGQPEPHLTNRRQRSEIGHLLYQHLRGAPDFLYAHCDYSTA